MSFFNFIDYVKISIFSGNGGSGCIHFRKEKYVIKGGPDGGDGGDGGSIIIKGNYNLYTLLHLKYIKKIYAKNGESGTKNNQHGLSGKNSTLELPIGTVIRDFYTKKILEIINNTKKKILLYGGEGGFGNFYFKSSVNKTPRFSQKGKEGVKKIIILELKLIAEIGLIGFPNSGKSTLLSVISLTKSKIDNYPFTTLVPHLGIINYKNNKSFIIADIPGIIYNASLGKGLGIRFLKHIEKNKILLFIISAESLKVNIIYKKLLYEIKNYNKKLLNKKILVIISKSDLINIKKKKKISEELININYIFISSFTREGILIFKKIVFFLLKK